MFCFLSSLIKFDEYIDYNDCKINFNNLANIVIDIEKYLNEKFEPLFDGISSKEIFVNIYIFIYLYIYL